MKLRIVHGLVWSVATGIGVAACAWMPQREHPSPQITADASPQARAAQCKDLRAEIAWYRKNQRAMPPTTNSPEIAAAQEGKTDNKIDELRQRLAALDCDSD
ncbi:MAG: hypothetical protein ACHQAR_00150 [Steroidobacterales bacterium]